MNTTKAVYLDYNATAPIRPEVKQAVSEAMEHIGNPSSVHGFGRTIRKHVEAARDQLAQAINADPKDVTFTSGATESNNMVLRGVDADRIYVSSIEHPSLIDSAQSMSSVQIIPCQSNGVIDLEWLKAELDQHSGNKILISVMWVNNETGVIQPIEDIISIAKAQGNVLVHTDAVQALGRMPIDVQALGCDFISFSAHKIGGLSGIGALIYDHDLHLNKIIEGGGQEKRRRSGTENHIGIISFGVAAEYAIRDLERFQAMDDWRIEAEKEIKDNVSEAIIFGSDVPRVANTIQVSLPGIPAEKQLMNLDLTGISVSSGAACSSGSIRPSHVLKAMGASDDEARGALRISMGWDSQKADIDYFVKQWIPMAQKLLQSSRGEATKS